MHFHFAGLLVGLVYNFVDTHIYTPLFREKKEIIHYRHINKHYFTSCETILKNDMVENVAVS